MKSKDLKPLKVSLHGMNERMHKMMVNYLKLPCKGTAIVVDDDNALVEIVDVDLSPSKTLLEERLAQQPSKPIIALSLDEISTSGVIYVKKPIEVPDVLAAFAVAKDVILGKTTLEKITKPADTPTKILDAPDETKAASKPEPQLESTKGPADVIQQALQKSEVTGKLTDQEEYLRDIVHKEVTLDYTKQQPEKVLPQQKSEFQDLKNVPSVKDNILERAVEKSQDSPKTNISSTTQPKPEPVNDKSEFTQLDLETKLPEQKKNTSSPEKVEPYPIETETFDEQQTTTQDEIAQPAATPEFLKRDDISVTATPVNDDTREIKKHVKKPQTSSKSKKKTSLDQTVTLKQPAIEQPISTIEASVAKPGKDLQYTKEKNKPVPADKLATSGSSGSFLDILWHRKNLITGLTCLFTLIAGIYIFQLTPIYETRARIFISNSNTKNIDVNSTSPIDTIDTLDKTTAQKKINEIASRQLAGRVIKALQLSTIPEFFAASINSDVQDTSSKLRLERQAAEQISNITDYFLQNLNVTQFKKLSYHQYRL